MKRFSASCFIAFMVSCAVSAGALLTDWNAGNVLVSVDANDYAGDGGREILGMRYRQTGGFYYFRLDIAEAPVQVANEFASQYGIWIDYTAGGGTDLDTAYIPDIPGGVLIDQWVDGHYSFAGAWTAPEHLHNYTGGGTYTTTLLASVVPAGAIFDPTEDAGGGAGTMLQWRIPVAALGTQPFDIYGATIDNSTPGPGNTFDLTDDPIHTPEPSGIALMATLGLTAAGMLLRRRARNA